MWVLLALWIASKKTSACSIDHSDIQLTKNTDTAYTGWEEWQEADREARSLYPFWQCMALCWHQGLLIDLTPTSIPARGWPCILLILLQAICGPHVWHFVFGLRRRMFGVSLPLYLLHLPKQFCLRPCLACLAWMAWAIWSSWSLIKSTLNRFKITEQSSVCTLMPAWCQSDSHALDQILPDPSGDLGRMILVSQLVIGMDVK